MVFILGRIGGAQRRKRKRCRILRGSSPKANEKADELEKEGALPDEGFLAEARPKAMQQEREELYAALQYAASFHCWVEQRKDCGELRPKPREKRIFVDKSEETKHRTEWCAEADRDRCMRSGRGSKHMKMPRKCTGQKLFPKSSAKWRTSHLGGHDLVRRMDREGEVLIWCRKCSRYATQRMGPKLTNCCNPEQIGTQEYGKMLTRIQVLEVGRVPAKEAKSWIIEGQKRRITRKEYHRLVNKFEMKGFMAQKGSWNLVREKVLRETGELPKEVGDVITEYKATHEEKCLSSWLREDGRE